MLRTPAVRCVSLPASGGGAAANVRTGTTADEDLSYVNMAAAVLMQLKS